MADGFIWYELATKDIDKAVAFYGRVVGWEMRDSGMPGVRYMLFGMNGKDVGGIMSWSGMGAPDMQPEWVGHIHTAKLDEELAAVQADGGTVVRPATEIPGVGRFAVVLDPQRVKYLLFEPRPNETRVPLEQMAPGNVGWHELLTQDGEKAWEYYSRHYGWQKAYAHNMGPMGVYQTFRISSDVYTGGMLSIVEGPGMPQRMQPGWKFYFTVDDLAAAQARVAEAGGTVTMPPIETPGGSRVMQCVDDQGGRFCLMQAAPGL